MKTILWPGRIPIHVGSNSSLPFQSVTCKTVNNHSYLSAVTEPSVQPLIMHFLFYFFPSRLLSPFWKLRMGQNVAALLHGMVLCCLLLQYKINSSGLLTPQAAHKPQVTANTINKYLKPLRLSWNVKSDFYHTSFSFGVAKTQNLIIFLFPFWWFSCHLKLSLNCGRSAIKI